MSVIRLSQPLDSADMISFLLSPWARYLFGLMIQSDVLSFCNLFLFSFYCKGLPPSLAEVTSVLPDGGGLWYSHCFDCVKLSHDLLANHRVHRLGECLRELCF